MRANWGRYAPLPFVGATILLIVLILLTPVLISTGQPAPGIFTEAELIVDRIPGVNATHFYIRALGSTVRYDGIWVGGASNFAWTGLGVPNWTSLKFAMYWNGTTVVTLAFNSTYNPIALNITAYYASPSGNAFYVGELALYSGPGVGPTGQDLYVATSTSGLTVPSATPIDNSTMPLAIVLAIGAGGRVP
jgi:hypothetical protein